VLSTLGERPGVGNQSLRVDTDLTDLTAADDTRPVS
jgi:hypothetical protein